MNLLFKDNMNLRNTINFKSINKKMNIILIGFGGALGAVSRYIVNELISKYLSFQIPLGILTVNIIGCFLIGLLMSTLITIKDNNYYFLLLVFWDLLQLCQPLYFIKASSYLIIILYMEVHI